MPTGSLSSCKIRGRKHWEDMVPPGALRLPTQNTTTGKRLFHGGLQFSSIHTEMRIKEILQPTTSRSVLRQAQGNGLAGTARLAFTPNLSVQWKDQKVHSARILFQPPVVSVFLDDSSAPVLESVVELSIVVDRQGGAWVGFRGRLQ